MFTSEEIFSSFSQQIELHLFCVLVTSSIMIIDRVLFLWEWAGGEA